MAQENTETGIDRRRVLQTLGGLSVAGGLAGCGAIIGDDDDNGSGDDGATPPPDPTDEEELGERVPEVVVEFPSGYGPWEDLMPIVQDDVEGPLGIDFSPRGVGLSGFLDNVYSDQRTFHYSAWGNTSPPVRIDPFRYMRMLTAEKAGPNGQANYASYVGCEYSDLVFGAQSMGDEQEREETFQEAMTLFSNEVLTIPFVPRPTFIAGRGDQMDFGPGGDLAFDVWNTWFFVESEPVDDDVWVYGTQVDFVERTNHFAITGLRDQPLFNMLPNSPLIQWNPDLELEGVLAEDWSINEDATQYTFNLRDSTFHNGDPVTSEEVKWTFETIEEKADQINQAETQGIESIETPDDSTVVVNFSGPNPSFIAEHVAMFGILHPPTWEDMDDVDQFNPDVESYVGSGPYELDAFEADRLASYVPYEDHAKFTARSQVVVEQFDDKATKLRGFREGELQVADELTGADFGQLEQQLSEDIVERSIRPGLGNWMMYASWPQAPGRFDAFSDAIGKAIDRERINAVLFDGLAEPVTESLFFTQDHPSVPPREELHVFTDDETGDPGAAQQVLQDAGWGWDDEGNLHYPQDVDLSPVYPEGELPDPDDFPCLASDGSYLPPEDR